MRIPGDGYFRLDTQKGTEKLWVISTAEPAAELERLTQWATSTYAGQIQDAGQVASLVKLVHSAARPPAEKDEAGARTVLKGSAALMVHEIQLNHY